MTRHEKSSTRRNLIELQVTPTGLQQTLKTSAKTQKPELVVHSVGHLVAKTDDLSPDEIELVRLFRSLNEPRRCQLIEELEKLEELQIKQD